MRKTCSSRVLPETLEKLEKLSEITGMTKGALVDRAIANLYEDRALEESLVIQIRRKEDREWIIRAIRKECARTINDVLKMYKEREK